jgi:acyl dehydratase
MGLADHRAAPRAFCGKGGGPMNFFEDFEVGQRRDIGSFTFTAEGIRKFAAQFDPQRFHLDEEEGRKSLFGGLAASGWHVASVCMKLLVADGQRRTGEAAARGEKIAVWGPSPGFRDLRWIKPVLAGDTIHFSSTIESLRPSEKRPEWGLLQGRHTGTNQRGELAFSMLATVFVPRRSSGSQGAVISRE